MNQNPEHGAAAADLTAAEAAAALGVSTVTVRRWAASGELPAVRLRGGRLARYRIRPGDLMAFVRPADAEREADEARP